MEQSALLNELIYLRHSIKSPELSERDQLLANTAKLLGYTQMEFNGVKRVLCPDNRWVLAIMGQDMEFHDPIVVNHMKEKYGVNL